MFMPSLRDKPSPQPTLKAWRVYLGLTLEQVGNKIGKTPQAIHKWEAGKVPVTLDNLQLLAQAYGIEAPRLLFMPDEAALEGAFRRAHFVLSHLDASRAVRWLEMGEDLASVPPAQLALPPPDKKT